MNCSGLTPSSILISRRRSEPEVNSVESDECVGQQPRLLSQHDRSIVIKPPTVKDVCEYQGLHPVCVCVCVCEKRTQDLVVLRSLSAEETYSANLFSIRTTLIQARPCRETLQRH